MIPCLYPCPGSIEAWYEYEDWAFHVEYRLFQQPRDVSGCVAVVPLVRRTGGAKEFVRIADPPKKRQVGDLCYRRRDRAETCATEEAIRRIDVAGVACRASGWLAPGGGQAGLFLCDGSWHTGFEHDPRHERERSDRMKPV